MISIHVPMRARRTEINSTGDFVNFNPRAHEGTTGLPGARRQAAYISIHVPMRARLLEEPLIISFSKFQSTCP